MTVASQNGPSNSTTSPVLPGAQQGIFVFEADTAAFASRKRAARACASCQKRKKRCPHTFTKDVNGNPVNASSEGKEGAEKVLPHLTHKEPVRFVGDMNPESILTDLSTREKGSKRLSRVGTWLEQSKLRQAEQLRREEEERASGAVIVGGIDTRDRLKVGAVAQNGPHATQTSIRGGSGARLGSKSAAVEKYSKIERARRTLTGHQKNYLQAIGAFRVLPKVTEDALISTYLVTIDPLLPIVDGATLLRDYAAGEASIFLIQAICLVTCKTEEAKDYLRLYEDGPLLDPIPFARSLYTGLDAAIKADLEADRLTKVQILTLMSLHNDGPGGIENASLCLVQAIHEAQTIGVHINTPGRTRNDQRAMLWWTLWMLDKFNACLGGRPLIIAERDVDIEEPEPGNTPRDQALQIWIRIAHLLDQVIEYYRPITDPDVTGYEDGFPTFEDLIRDCATDLVLPFHQKLLELSYNIVGILACRSGGPSTQSYRRRIVCADQIQSIVSDEWRHDLPPLPLVPYATSLSLTVVYRGLRDHCLARDVAFKSLSKRCEVLEILQKAWWTADAMAKLGRKALKSLQQPQPVQRRDEIEETMDLEVSPCKYGPFDGPKTKSQVGHVANSAAEIDRDIGASNSANGVGNALHVLSDAAATHSLKPHANGVREKRPRSSLADMTSNDSDLDAKRRRMEGHRLSYQSSNGNSPASPAHVVTFSGLPSLTNASTPTTMTNATLHGTSGSPKLHQPLQNMSLHPPVTPSHLGSSSTFLSPVSNTNDGSLAAALNYSDPGAFIDLDNLFDGFFDLSMPTMFQDPLFDGQNFVDWSPSANFNNHPDIGVDMGVDVGVNMTLNPGGPAVGPTSLLGAGDVLANVAIPSVRPSHARFVDVGVNPAAGLSSIPELGSVGHNELGGVITSAISRGGDGNGVGYGGRYNGRLGSMKDSNNSNNTDYGTNAADLGGWSLEMTGHDDY